MKRFYIAPDVQRVPVPWDAARGGMPGDYELAAKALLREDPKGTWVHFDDAEAAIKHATESAGTVTLRQRYKLAALTAFASGQNIEQFKFHARPDQADEVVAACASYADAMIAEDEAHAKK